MNYWAMWLMVIILLTILEFATVNLVSVWFIASGILALILSLFVDNLVWQFGVFVVVGILLMVLTKPLLSKVSNKEVEKLNLERVIGMPGIVTQEIKSGRVGEVKIDGKIWNATSLEDLEVDTMILVEKMDGEKLCVVRNEPEVVEVPLEIAIPEEKKDEVLPQEVEDTLEEEVVDAKRDEASPQEETSLKEETAQEQRDENPPQEEAPLKEEVAQEPLGTKEIKKEDKPAPKKKSSSKRKHSSKRKSSNKSQNNHH